VPSLTPYAPLVMVVAVIAGFVVWPVGKRRPEATVTAFLVVAWV